MYNNRETYEWTNLWWDEANGAGERILLIGDSISFGYRGATQELLSGKYHVDLLSTSKFAADPSYERELRYVLSEYPYACVHFNNGLHGLTLSDEDYERGCRRIIEVLLESVPAVVLATSTPYTVDGDGRVLHPENNAVVLRRNKIMERLAREYGLPLDDLYTAALAKTEYKLGDGCHFTMDGYRYLAGFVADSTLGAI